MGDWLQNSRSTNQNFNNVAFLPGGNVISTRKPEFEQQLQRGRLIAQAEILGILLCDVGGGFMLVPDQESHALILLQG